MAASGKQRTVALGIDPGLANTGWGIVEREGARFRCLAYGCISTSPDMELSRRLMKIHEQMGAIIERYRPTCVGIETIWFGENITAAFATGQARGAALVACAEAALSVGEYAPKNIKNTVVGTGDADKRQVQYMMKQLLGLEREPRPDHAADALAAAMCYLLNNGPTSRDALR
ncbi:MAG: crossover junction endodeoxyribonuclease RuvC [Coriobacteriaceae bacterium]|nr:crossover junction endodeoxyribonuclease RuvC [Coriobacteriaceae bacterium]